MKTLKNGFYVSPKGQIEMLEILPSTNTHVFWKLEQGEIKDSVSAAGALDLEDGWQFAGVTRLELYNFLKAKAHVEVFGS